MRQIGPARIRIAVHQDDVDRLRRIGVRQRRMRNPIDAGHLFAVEPHFFVERAAQRMQHPALDRVAQRLGVDDEPAVVRAHQSLHPHAARRAIHFDFRDFRDDGLVAERVRDPAAGEDVSGASRSW